MRVRYLVVCATSTLRPVLQPGIALGHRRFDFGEWSAPQMWRSKCVLRRLAHLKSWRADGLTSEVRVFLEAVVVLYLPATVELPWVVSILASRASSEEARAEVTR